ncbi:uncharacterized protein A4U43_C01F15590 [Asparagus officinalis]|uniref:Uncharacterized protein n=1 Tax=Asparagus officinalis TaxID=4686 RepID=A0A5P1FQF0_ASPOF|nr:uncharacterized protein A4U43_C01F15590 [Asparagus officinalis]
MPRFMRYNLTNREDSVKRGILKYGGGFRQEGLFGTNIIGLHPGFVIEDAPVNEIAIVPKTFGNELVKIDAQYPDGDARDSSRIREESPVVPVQEPRIGSLGKEPIPLDDE